MSIREFLAVGAIVCLGGMSLASFVVAEDEAITLTDRALSHLLKLRQERAAAAGGGQEQQMVFRVSTC